MSSAKDVELLLKKYIAKAENPHVDFQKFVRYVERYAGRYGEEYEQIQDLEYRTAEILQAHLLTLQEDEKVQLSFLGHSLESIFYAAYYLNLVRKEYRKIDASPERPFPTEDRIGAEIPGNRIQAIDIKSDLIRWIDSSEKEAPVLLRIMFPDNVQSILITSDLLKEKMAEFSLQKIRMYLRTEKNSSYMQQKLLTMFRQKEMPLKDLLNSIHTSPKKALNSILNPTEFSFHVWTQLSTNIIKEFSQKNDKLIEEHNYCQAAYCLGYYSLYYKGRRQREEDIQDSLKAMERNLHKAPYIYTMIQIRDFRDSKGVPLSKNCPQENFNEFLENQLKKKEGANLPDLLHVKGPDKKDYYVYKQYYISSMLRHLERAIDEFKDFYVHAWAEAMRQDKKVKSMLDDTAFEEQLRSRLEKTEPVLSALLNYNFLVLLSSEQKLPDNERNEVNRITDLKKKSLIPLPEILGLNRKSIHDEARLLLPFWQAIPILNKLVRLIKRIFIGKRRDDESEPVTQLRTSTMTYGAVGASRDGGEDSGNELSDGGTGADSNSRTSSKTGKAQLVNYRKQVQALQKKILGEGKSVAASLEELIEKWNPLLDPQAKKNLVEDVNSLIRDFMRRMKSGFKVKPPDEDRLNEMAEKLAYNHAFDTIRRKDYLHRYIVVYMLKLLGKR